MKTKINLLPKELRQKSKKIFTKSIGQKVKIIAVIAVVIISLKIGLNIIEKSHVDNVERVNQKISSYQSKWEKIREETKVIEQLKKRIEEKNKQIRAVDALLNKKLEVHNWLRLISLNIPEQVWLTELIFSKEKNYILLDGFGNSNLFISKFLGNLQALDDFSQILLKSTEKVDTPQGKFLRFRATGELR